MVAERYAPQHGECCNSDPYLQGPFIRDVHAKVFFRW